MPTAISGGYPRFADKVGKPLEGKLYFGLPNQNPVTNQKAVFWDLQMTQPVAQPVSVTGGYVMRAGTPSGIFTEGDYSITAQDNAGRLIFYAKSSAEFDNSNSILASAQDIQTNGLTTTLFNYNQTYAAGTLGKWLKDLALAWGASFIGWFNKGTNAVLRTVHDKLRDEADVKDYASIQDAVNAAVDIIISSPQTLSSYLAVPAGKRLVFRDAGKLTINSGGNLIVSEVEAPDRQIFYGINNGVEGLKESKLVWFTGDFVNTSTDVHPQIQSCYNSVVTSGKVIWVDGYVSVAGGIIYVTKGQKTIGSGSFNSQLRFIVNTASYSSHGWRVEQTIGASFEKVGWFLSDETEIVSGVGIFIAPTASYTTIDQVFGRGGGIGIIVLASNCRITNLDLIGCYTSGVAVSNIENLHMSNFRITAPFDYVSVNMTAGTFQVGEIVTHATSGASGKIESITSTGSNIAQLRVYRSSVAEFANYTTLVGATSGASASISLVTYPHQSGAIKLENRVEGFVAQTGSVTGGRNGLVTDAGSYTAGSRPAHCRFSDVIFYPSAYGSHINKAVEFTFTGCSFTARPHTGVTIENSDNIKFIGGGSNNCGSHGVFIKETAKRVVIQGFSAVGNSTDQANTYDGIYVAFGTTDFVVSNCILTNDGIGTGLTQRYGIRVEHGPSGRYSITNNLISGNASTGAWDGGYGPSKNQSNNF
jgi:hypothetical protein